MTSFREVGGQLHLLLKNSCKENSFEEKGSFFYRERWFADSWKDMLAMSKNTYLEMPMNHILGNKKKECKL